MRLPYLSLTVGAMCLLAFGGSTSQIVGLSWLAIIAVNCVGLTGYQRRQLLGLRPPV
jgi:putative exporter of polyketide antibiotics